MAKWWKIETAPKDGTPIIGFAPDAIEPQQFFLIWTDWVDKRGRVIGGNWTDLGNDQEFDASLTHWRHLSKPPDPVTRNFRATARVVP